MEEITRRNFLKASVSVGSLAVFGYGYSPTLKRITTFALGEADNPDSIEQPDRVIYSACLQCHNDCTIRTKIEDGRLVKIDGSPYGPQNRIPHLPYETSPSEALMYAGILCPKGQAGIQTAYDPYRIKTVLKRAGSRGSNKWKTIPYNQALDEITNGGDLFGEGNVEGLRDIYTDFPNEMAADAKKVPKDMKVSDFKAKWKDKLDLLIDPDHPDMGPKNNQFVFMAGRIEHGRKDLSKRFVKDSFGSANWFEHTTICEQSHHIAFGMATGKHHLKPDILNCEYLIYFGTNPMEANFGPTNLAHKLSEAKVKNGLKMVVIDPRMSNSAAKADKWVPIKPGGDAALALGMARWIIDNGRYNRKYLENPNKTAAVKDGETTWTDATYLVKIENGNPTKPLRADEVGLGNNDEFVVSSDGKLTTSSTADYGELEVDTTVKTETGNVRVKTAFLLFKERASEKSLEEYAKLAGVNVTTISELASEFTDHGKRACADLYRGPVQHTNGYYTGTAIIYLNTLIGNYDWRGGMTEGGGHYHETGGKSGNPYHLSKLHPDKKKSFGVNLTREKWNYGDTTLFDGYPAKRMWFPFTGNVFQEVIPSAADGYPYPIKVLLLHKGTPVLSTPAGKAYLKVLKDRTKIPLFIASDIVIGETSMYADYIFPDLTYPERWGTPHMTPDVPIAASKIRQPTVNVYPNIKPLEQIFIDIAKKMNLSGFGDNAFGNGMGLNSPEDYYLKLAANIAFEKNGVPGADNNELGEFSAARSHLPPYIYDESRWKSAVKPDEWSKVVYVLSRGGRFENADKAYDGDHMSHKIAGMIHFYVEKVAAKKDSITGNNFDGLPRYDPVLDAGGRQVMDLNYPYRLITFKSILHGHSRTIADAWLTEILPENYLVMNKKDAETLGVKLGDTVKITSATNSEGETGKVVPLEGIRPGVVAVSWHYGHWAYGSEDYTVNGNTIKGDKKRGTGIVPNPVMREDPYFLEKNASPVCLQDPIGGSASFYDTRVKVIKL